MAATNFLGNLLVKLRREAAEFRSRLATKRALALLRRKMADVARERTKAPTREPHEAPKNCREYR